MSCTYSNDEGLALLIVENGKGIEKNVGGENKLDGIIDQEGNKILCGLMKNDEIRIWKIESINKNLE